MTSKFWVVACKAGEYHDAAYLSTGKNGKAGEVRLLFGLASAIRHTTEQQAAAVAEAGNAGLGVALFSAVACEEFVDVRRVKDSRD